MPFQSEAQRRFMYSQHPELAKEFEAATPKNASLPEHVKMADGGTTDPMAGNPSDSDPGDKDASVSDFLLPYLLGPSTMKAGADIAEGAGAKLADEAGAIFPQKAPLMEDAIEGATTKDVIDPKKVEVYTKSIQKGAPGGSGDVIIRGVRGDPEEIAKLGYGPDPASVPEHILQKHGLLPTPGPQIPQASPTGYAEGGKVERSSLAHPTPNGMMARPMADGGYPHVTFMENQTPEENEKTTHLAKSPAKMAEGGTIHKAEDRNKEPAKPKDIDISHEKKLNSIYKAMGIKKYADGGTVDDISGTNGQPQAPSPSDPDYWDQIKATLAQVGASTQNALGLGAPTGAPIPPQATNPNLTAAIQAGLTGGASSAVAPLNPTGTPGVAAVPGPDALNTLGLGRLAAAPPPAAPVAAPVMPPAAMPPAMPLATPAPTPSGAPSGMPNLSTIFNQDTSKLTEGVNPEDRQALAQQLQSQQHGTGAIIAQAVAGLGDALAAKGGKEQNALGNIFAMQKTQRDEALANFDAARQQRLQKLQLQTTLGDNALKQAAAADAYGVDEHLNSMIGAPKGTMKKDLPTYFQLAASQIAAKEKDEDLYMKAHAQAGTDVDNAVKNSSVLGIKPSPAQLQASGAKLADNYYNRAKGNVLVKPSDGGQAQWIPAQNLGKAKQMDPNLQVQ